MQYVHSSFRHHSLLLSGTRYTEGRRQFLQMIPTLRGSFIFMISRTKNIKYLYWFGMDIVYRFPNIIIRLRQMHASRSWNSKRKLKWFFFRCYLFLLEFRCFSEMETVMKFSGLTGRLRVWFTIFFHSPKSILMIFTEWNLILVEISNTALGQCIVKSMHEFCSFHSKT